MKFRTLIFNILLCLLPSWALAQTDTIVFSAQGGFYDEVFSLELRCGNPKNHIRFTINGNDPTQQSPLYTEPLVLDERMYSKSDIYKLHNCPEDQFRTLDSIDHCIVIRAAVFDENDHSLSETFTNSYFIRALGCNTHGLPVVSLCVDSVDLFDFDRGIFVIGANYDPEKPYWSGNYYQRGKDWERWANFEFYEFDNTGVNQQCGVRTHGGNGRRFQQKTLKVTARKKYGKKSFQHQFFPNIPEHNFKNLVLRPFLSSNGGCEDYICNRLAQQLGLDFMADRPSVMFINGEYWGIYYVKEKPDEHYVEDHYGINSKEVNLMAGWWESGCESGSPENYINLYNWMKNADLSDEEQYAYAAAHIDIDNFLNYYLLEMFIANFDWPANNVRFWQAGDGKFRWMFYDGDSALENYKFDVYANATYYGKEKYPSNNVATLFFRRLLKSPIFKKKFAQRYNQLMVTTFSFENTKPIYDTILATLDAEAHRQFERFDPPEEFYPSKYRIWKDRHMKRTLDFLRERPKTHFISLPYPSIKEAQCIYKDNRVVLQIESQNFGSDKICVFDLNGKRVYTQSCVLASGSNVVLVGTDLPPGMYIVRVSNYYMKVLWL